MKAWLTSLIQYRFLFFELSKRDFTKKYKRSVLGVFWSVLSPLLTLLVMNLVFTRFFGHTIQQYTIYLFAGNIVFSYFNEATNTAMGALVGNKDIFSKVNLPKYMFVLASNTSSLINFVITFLVFMVFVIAEGLPLTLTMLGLIIPVLFLMLFNVGVSLILSALYLFFADMRYLYSVFTLLLMYLSAIFYSVDSFSQTVQRLFLINPIYVYIKCIRVIVIDGNLPSPQFLIGMALYAVLALLLGVLVYQKNSNRFIYYV